MHADASCRWRWGIASIFFETMGAFMSPMHDDLYASLPRFYLTNLPECFIELSSVAHTNTSQSLNTADRYRFYDIHRSHLAHIFTLRVNERLKMGVRGRGKLAAQRHLRSISLLRSQMKQIFNKCVHTRKIQEGRRDLSKAWTISDRRRSERTKGIYI